MDIARLVPAGFLLLPAPLGEANLGSYMLQRMLNQCQFKMNGRLMGFEYQYPTDNINTQSTRRRGSLKTVHVARFRHGLRQYNRYGNT
jgi:hypothetical protein